MKRLFGLSAILFASIIYFCFQDRIQVLLASPRAYTITERIEQYGAAAHGRWQPYFDRANSSYPPRRIVLVGLKEERVLEVYVAGSDNALKFIRSYPICAAGGRRGPKLQEGDQQVPEGIYRVSFLNANSRYHLSLRVNYPNDFDRQKASLDGRTDLGGDIMIHGSCVSIGCLAMQDQAAEDLFVLAHTVGLQNTRVLLAPFDFRKRSPSLSDVEGLPAWTPELYQLIQKEFDRLPQRTN